MHAPSNPPSKSLERFLQAGIDTPALVLDLDLFDRNVAALASYFREQGVAWRPHAKSYKCSELVRRVVAAGAIGATCAKLSEAERFGRAGVRDLLITGPVVGPRKARRLAELRRIADPIAVVDHVDHLPALSAAAADAGVRLRILLEINLGMNRCGVEPGEPALALARQVASTPGLDLAGVMAWEGHLLTLPADEKSAKIADAMRQFDDVRRQLEADGLPCPIVSAGGTGSFQTTAPLGVANEIQAGGAAFMDLFYRRRCGVVGLDYALTVVASVISRPAADRAVIDAGRKTLSPDLHPPEVKGRDDLQVAWLSAEHGVLKVLDGPGPKLGEPIELILGYGDWTTVLHDRYHVFQGDRYEGAWELDARNCSD